MDEITDMKSIRLPEISQVVERPVRRVLVIGGAGFVGSVLNPKLLDRGYGVTVMDSLLYGDDGVRDLYDRPGFVFRPGDLRSVEDIVRAARDADAIVHLGGIAGDPACDLDEDLTVEVNLAATRTVAEVARGLGIQRLVFASSCSVYGASDGLLDEESPVAPVSTYARTKMQSEELLRVLTDREFAPVSLRFGTFYGLSPRPRFDLIINLLAAKAVVDGEITIFGGDQWRPFVHVDDGAEVITRCLELPLDAVSGQVFNVGSDEQNYTLADVAGMIEGLLPGVRVNFTPKSEREANYRVSFAKLRTTVSFVPRHSLLDGVRQVQEALESGSITHYLEDRYSNHRSLVRGHQDEPTLVVGNGTEPALSPEGNGSLDHADVGNGNGSMQPPIPLDGGGIIPVPGVA